MQIFMIVTSQKGVIDMRAGFIGAGKVGFSLGKYLKENGVEITGYFSKSPESAKSAADFTNTKLYKSIENILSDSDTLFITVPEDAHPSLLKTHHNVFSLLLERVHNIPAT